MSRLDLRGLSARTRRMIAACIVSVIVGVAGIGVGVFRQGGLSDAALDAGEAVPEIGELRFERLDAPGRTIARDRHRRIVAVMTDGARTASLLGRSRVINETATTRALVVDHQRVVLMPRPWAPEAQSQPWYRDWFSAAVKNRDPDLLDIAAQYITGADQGVDAAGVQYRGDARYRGPAPSGGEPDSDFNDYLGVPFTFPNGTTRRPDPGALRTLSTAGFVRLVYGYRGGLPLARTADDKTAMAPSVEGMHRGMGVDVASATDAPVTDLSRLQAGDLLFFDTDTDRGLDQVGIYIGLDQDNEHRFIMSRRAADGPTMGDKGGPSVIDEGRFATALRAVKRL
ncbi:hypothetical protein GCM10027289_17370 [Tsukamurella serpentis]